MSEIFTDPATGRPYRINQATGNTEWLEPPPPADGSAPTGKPRRKRRVFLWVFLAVQALFIIWLIVGISSASGPATDCGTLDQPSCNDAESVGTAIGAGLIIVFWAIVDFILAVTYAIYRLTKRS